MRSVSPPASEHFIYPGLTEIGARPPARIIVDQPQISSRHAVLESLQGPDGRWEVILTDHGSTNGTFVNDKRIKRCRLKDGDRIRLARVEFDFRYVEHR
jgi:pSer/pThr/pTyr-binding forkhead associated (FHA) protein